VVFSKSAILTVEICEPLSGLVYRYVANSTTQVPKKNCGSLVLRASSGSYVLTDGVTLKLKKYTLATQLMRIEMEVAKFFAILSA